MNETINTKPIEKMEKDELITLQVEVSKKLNEQIMALDAVETAQGIIDKDLSAKRVEKANLMALIADLENQREVWETPIKKAKANLSMTRAALRSIEHLIFKKPM